MGVDTTVGPNHDTEKNAHANGIKSSSTIGTEVVELCVLTRNEVVVEEEDSVGFWSFNNCLSRLVSQNNLKFNTGAGPSGCFHQWSIC